MMAMWRMGVLGIVSLAIVGCQEPPPIIPAQPPGEAYVPPVPTAEKEGVQAIGEQAEDPEKIPPAPPTAKGETKTTKSGVKYETLKEGTGPEVKGGQSVEVQYTGTLENGEVFDTSRKEGKPPYTFIPGVSQVIKGWSEGVPGMRVGERRKLIIPPELGYGEKEQGKIPPNSTLIFDIEVISAK